MRLGMINPGPERDRLLANVNAREFVNRGHWNDWEPILESLSTAVLRGLGAHSTHQTGPSIHSKCRGAKNWPLLTLFVPLTSTGRATLFRTTHMKRLITALFFLFTAASAWAQPQDATLHVATRLVKPFAFEENRELTGFSLELS